jgi:hypothetical protein
VIHVMHSGPFGGMVEIAQDSLIPDGLSAVRRDVNRISRAPSARPERTGQSVSTQEVAQPPRAERFWATFRNSKPTAIRCSSLARATFAKTTTPTPLSGNSPKNDE